MRVCLFLAAGVAALASPAGAATITSEDFEAGAFGWSDNKTETPGANTGSFTRHLGRHGVGATTSKTFALSGTQTSVTVAFDWYRLDSWDGEFFQATITDSNSQSFTSSSQGFFNDGGPANIYSPNWTDRNTRISFDFATGASSITLRFSSTLDQDLGDEAWGVDNLVITSNSGNAVPEPATWAMMVGGFGMLGAATRRQRKVIAA